MVNTAQKLGWIPAVAIVTSDPPQVRYFGLEALRRSRETYKVHESTAGHRVLSELVFSTEA